METRFISNLEARMNWKNLKSNKCPHCSLQLNKGVSASMHFCKCGFSIS